MKLQLFGILMGLGVVFNAQALTNFDETAFSTNGPLQQGTVRINRGEAQTVITWCTPSLLRMEVLSGNQNIPIDYVKTFYGSLPKQAGAHPEQVSVTVFPRSLPFSYTKNYSKPAYVTSACRPSSIHTTLQQSPAASTALMRPRNLTKPFTVIPTRPTVIQLDCASKTIGYHFGSYHGPSFGTVGGVAMIPKGKRPVKIKGTCDAKGGFSITLG